MCIGKTVQNLLLDKELRIKSDSMGKVCANCGQLLEGSRIFYHIYMYIFHHNSRSLHQPTEIDMAVFEALL